MTVNEYRTAHPERTFVLTGLEGTCVKIPGVAMDCMIPEVYEAKILKVTKYAKSEIRNIYIDYKL